MKEENKMRRFETEMCSGNPIQYEGNIYIFNGD